MATALDLKECDAPLFKALKNQIDSRTLVQRRSNKPEIVTKTLNKISDNPPSSTVERNFYKHIFNTLPSEDVFQRCYLLNAIRLSHHLFLTCIFITISMLKVNLFQLLCLNHIFHIIPKARLCHTQACMTGFSVTYFSRSHACMHHMLLSDAFQGHAYTPTVVWSCHARV